jgi:hypothetical protein
MNSLIKLLAFSRERILVYRVLKWLHFTFKFDLSASLFIKGIKQILANPKLRKNLSIEENFAFYRGYHLSNSNDITSLPICWRDVYGISVRLEHIMDSNIKVPSDYLNLIYLLASCFVEDRGRFTNNHYLMNLLILKRFSEYYREKLYFTSSEVNVAYNHVFKSNVFLERSSHYLFIISLRLSKIIDKKFLSMFNKDIYTFYESIIPYYSTITWLGDICPDKIKLDKIKYGNNESPVYLNFGYFIFFKVSNLILKISTNNSILRHGHKDYGSIVYHSESFQLVDLGINDLSNKKYKLSKLHPQYELGKFIRVKKDNDHFKIYFSNCLILFSSTGINLIWDKKNIPQKIKLFCTGPLKYLKSEAKSFNLLDSADNIIYSSFKQSKPVCFVLSNPTEIRILNEK